MKNTFEDTLLAWAIRDTTSGSFARPKFKIKKIDRSNAKRSQMDDVVKAKNSISTLSIDRLPSEAGQKGERDPEYETSNSELCALHLVVK